MRASAALSLLVLIAACGSSGSNGGRPDGGSRPDGGFVDSGPEGMHRDAGPTTSHIDASYSDPAVLFDGLRDINGLNTYVHLMGTTTSTLPTVLFVSMGPGFGFEYLPDFHRFLLPGRLLVYFDLRAQGRSSTTMVGSSSITADIHATGLGAVIDYASQLGASSTVDLIGHGYGAGVASLRAARDPRHIGRMVLIAPFPLEPYELADFNAEAQSRLTQGERTLTNMLKDEPFCRGNVRLCTIQLWNMLGPHYLCEPNRERFSQMTFIWGDFRQEDAIEYNLVNEQYNWRRELPRINVPTTIISGPCDPTPERTAAGYASLIPGAVHIVLDAGYFPMVEQTAIYQRIVRQALDR